MKGTRESQLTQGRCTRAEVEHPAHFSLDISQSQVLSVIKKRSVQKHKGRLRCTTPTHFDFLEI